MTDPYETRHGPEYWQAQQEAALDALGFTWRWCLIARLKACIAEIKEEIWRLN